MVAESQGLCGSSLTRLLSKWIIHLPLLICDHHQVCQLVDNDHDHRKGHSCFISDWALYSATLSIGPAILRAPIREELVAIFHSSTTFAGLTSLAWVGHHWTEVRNIIVDRKLHPSLDRHHKLDFVRRAFIKIFEIIPLTATMTYQIQ